MLCMNMSSYAIIYSFIHKMCFSCDLRYILPSEIESFLKGICSIYRSSIDMILKVTSNFKIP